ncbi:MAG: hypothetical protein D6689_03180 [Deltaproteobacteria bacterium]|nr:MAG: hypothetical protein D6689_03180 [Deltaproteobacteria bacterium]
MSTARSGPERRRRRTRVPGAAAAAAVAVVAAVAVGSCARPPAPARPRQPTGTCPGACAHYLRCKGEPDDTATFAACVTECRATFDDPDVLADYERLDCDDAVAFIEGDSGRGPGAAAPAPRARRPAPARR